jgi:broad specificity phosphatase PhoE
MKNSENIIAGRHLEDVNDLRNGLDTELKKEQGGEVIQNIKKLSLGIIENTKSKGKQNILLVHSSKKRASQTCEILKEKIKEESDLNVRLISDERFTELDHGEIFLPADYKPGKRVEFLADAWSIFWEETFNKDTFEFKSNYHFGDPVLLEGGYYKYPELKDKFKTTGESYLELSIRYYEALVDFFEKKKRIDESSTEFVLIAHSATLSILKQLGIVFKRGDFESGKLMEECWKEYNLSKKESGYKQSTFGDFSSFDISDLDTNKIVKVLKKEIVLLKQEYEKE